MNAFIIANREGLGNDLIVALFLFNSFLIFGNAFTLTVNWLARKIVHQRFKHEFEIGVEDEWERLAQYYKHG